VTSENVIGKRDLLPTFNLLKKRQGEP